MNQQTHKFKMDILSNSLYHIIFLPYSIWIIRDLQLNHGVINNKELELLIFNSVQISLENKISRELFNETLITLVQNHSIKSNTVGNMVCLSLPKDPQEQNIESRQNIVISDIDINEEFNKFKERFLEELRDLKTAFYGKKLL